MEDIQELIMDELMDQYHTARKNLEEVQRTLTTNNSASRNKFWNASWDVNVCLIKAWLYWKYNIAPDDVKIGTWHNDGDTCNFCKVTYANAQGEEEIKYFDMRVFDSNNGKVMEDNVNAMKNPGIQIVALDKGEIKNYTDNDPNLRQNEDGSYSYFYNSRWCDLEVSFDDGILKGSFFDFLHFHHTCDPIYPSFTLEKGEAVLSEWQWRNIYEEYKYCLEANEKEKEDKIIQIKDTQNNILIEFPSGTEVTANLIKSTLKNEKHLIATVVEQADGSFVVTKYIPGGSKSLLNRINVI